jgi:hypothetical protein
MKIYVAKKFMLVDPINNIFVFKGQVFMCEIEELPRTTFDFNWEDHYSCYFIQQ